MTPQGRDESRKFFAAVLFNHISFLSFADLIIGEFRVATNAGPKAAPLLRYGKGCSSRRPELRNLGFNGVV